MSAIGQILIYMACCIVLIVVSLISVGMLNINITFNDGRKYKEKKDENDTN